jgi:2-polyprenyl-3-methyl-5-hydroxy-6-metoxy-1,4-benzoquinol methylase
MSAQDVTLQQYIQWMRMNAATHLIRSARVVGIFAELRQGQRTLQQLCQSRSLQTEPTKLLLDALLAIGIVEQYEQDYALSRAAHLLCQYDDDLGDSRWEKLADAVQGTRSRQDNDDQQHFNHEAATQWIHTASAMQAAEILNIGGDGEPNGISILDIGCGSAVWSCAMAHLDPQATITAVDHAIALKAAQSTADSIELNERFRTIEAMPSEAELPDSDFDLVLLAQRLSGLAETEAMSLLKKSLAACKPGGRLVVIDLFRGPTKPNLVEAIEALRLDLETTGGRMPSLEQAKKMLQEAGLTDIQFTFLAASEVNLGMAIGVK